MYPSYDDVISNIRLLIKNKGIKQAFIAETAEMTPAEFSNILNDRRKLLRVEHVAPIAKALGVTPNELYGIGGES